MCLWEYNQDVSEYTLSGPRRSTRSLLLVSVACPKNPFGSPSIFNRLYLIQLWSSLLIFLSHWPQNKKPHNHLQLCTGGHLQLLWHLPPYHEKEERLRQCFLPMVLRGSLPFTCVLFIHMQWSHHLQCFAGDLQKRLYWVSANTRTDWIFCEILIWTPKWKTISKRC